MAKHPARLARERAYKLVSLQGLLVAVVSVICFVVWGQQHAVSALWGGAIAVIPNFVFASLAFAHSGARAAGNVVKAFYRGEAIKLMLTIVLFGLAFGVAEAEAPALFCCFIAAQMVHWTAPLLFQRKQ